MGMAMRIRMRTRMMMMMMMLMVMVLSRRMEWWCDVSVCDKLVSSEIF